MVLNCKMCGGSLKLLDNSSVYKCEYCGTEQTIPRIDDDQIVGMLNRANHFRQIFEFDKAIEIYERVIENGVSDADIYWDLVLCRYGIEYIDDPKSKEKIPTCHRAQYQTILEDADYLMALSKADSLQRTLFEKEANYINKVQKGILEISNKEEAFDVFICYKESDENGRRTADSVIAQDIYYQLTEKGYKVFFSRITLESKIGQEYEPYIFAALNSAKIMIVLGTKPEYFNSVWVKNEWNRFLDIMHKDKNRLIIPAYKDFDPYDLPDELSYFQALDMSKIGFVQDLLSGIKKVIEGSGSVTKSSLTGGYDISEERLVHNAEVYLSLDNLTDAKSAYTEITKKFPDNYKGWWGLIVCETNKFTRVVSDRSGINTLYGYVEKLVDTDTLEGLRNEYIEYLEILSKSEAENEIDIITDKIKKYGDLTRQSVMKIKATEEERDRVKTSKDNINSEINDAYARIDRIKNVKLAATISTIVVLGPVIVLLLIVFVEVMNANGPGGIEGDDILMIILSVLFFGVPWLILSGCVSAGIINGMKKGTTSIESEKRLIDLKVEETKKLKKTIKSLDNQISYERSEVDGNKRIMLELEDYQNLGEEVIADLLFEIMKREVNADYEIDSNLENVRKKVMNY